LPDATPGRPTLNIPLIVLWVASVAVAAVGFWQLRVGNAGQADFYNTGGSDYLTYLDLQTQSTIGGLLLTAGIAGVLIALAVHARNWHAASLARQALAASTPAAGYLAWDEDDDFGDADAATDVPATTDTEAQANATAAPAVAETGEPATEEAAEASAAVAATEEPAGEDAGPVAEHDAPKA